MVWPSKLPVSSRVSGGRRTALVDSITTLLGRARSLHEHEKRLPLLDDVGRELRGVAVADIPYGVDRLGRDEQDIAGVERGRRLALDLILERAFQHVDDLLAWML